jgi:predicted nuclease of restriction endonuclease-like (RecB) superfamily
MAKKEIKKELTNIEQGIESQPASDHFFESVASVIEQARKFVGRTADLTMTVTYFEIGRMIVEREQGGKPRAEYGKGLVVGLSRFLTVKYKRGFSESTIRNAIKFYLTYSPQVEKMRNMSPEKSQQIVTDFKRAGEIQKPQQIVTEFDTLNFWRSAFKLSWTQYLVLMRIDNEQERRFYEIESEREGWGVEKLRREYGKSLYERLALSRDKDEVMRLSREGQTIEKPKDIMKNPLVLEFLGMAEDAAYSESDLENAIITKLQDFLLELGKGFLFEARQKRFTYDEDSFFVDLVFYNRLLKCYVLIDLKTGKLKHQDLGQMQMYVNYFDRCIKAEDENPTIGILLCRGKSDGVVEMTLPKNANIYASQYSLYLPDKTTLQAKLAEWIAEFEDAHTADDD